MLATEILRRKQQTNPKRSTLSSSTRNRLCRRAVDFIDANALDSVTIADVCRASGTSLSTLERAFRDQFGITPKRYVINRRLMGVRRELRSGCQSAVFEAANYWGFWHMGQFARDYKRLFGELPSQTLVDRHRP